MNKGLIAVPSVAAMAASLLWAVPVHAEPVSAQESATVTNASMTWPVNACAFDVNLPACTSLTERQQLVGDVTRGETGWVFTRGDGVVTQAGDMTVSWDAEVQIGNTTRGNYSITFIDPVLTVDASGAGAITADVAWQIGTDTPVETENVVIVTFAGGSTSSDIDITPVDFDPAFIGSLNPQLSSWFSQNGSPLDPLKVPGAVTFDRWVPTLSVTLPKRFDDKNPRVTDKRFMVTVTGTGFDPAVSSNPAVQGLYVVFGPNPATTPDGYTNIDGYFRARYLPMGPGVDGSFTTKIQVRGSYSKNGQAVNGRFGEPIGVATWAAHRNASPEWRAFTQIRFRR